MALRLQSVTVLVEYNDFQN